MSRPPKEFDFWYAVNNTEVLELPRGRLESELDDFVGLLAAGASAGRG